MQSPLIGFGFQSSGNGFSYWERLFAAWVDIPYRLVAVDYRPVSSTASPAGYPSPAVWVGSVSVASSAGSSVDCWSTDC